jgi:enoyl-[acyl-carrier protein] reductase I
MSSAKAALESDTRVLAFEAGRAFGIRVNTISAGPLASRAAKAIGGAGKPKTFIDYAIDYSKVTKLHRLTYRLKYSRYTADRQTD